MRKLASFICAAGLALSMSAPAPAQAVQFYLNGSYEFQVQSYNNLNLNYMFGLQNTKDYYHNVGKYYPQTGPGQANQYHQKHLSFQQRWIMQGTFVASPNLMAYWDGILGYITWGGPAVGAKVNPQLYGGALGTRSGSLITRQAFMDWTIPDTKVKLRMGQQFFGLPYFATGATPINYEFGSGITLTAPITDWMDVIAIWCRAHSGPRRGSSAAFPAAAYQDDTWDIFVLAPTFKFDGFKLMPHLGMTLIGKDSLAPKISYGTPNTYRAYSFGNYNTGIGYYMDASKLGQDVGFAQDGGNWFPLYSAGAEANLQKGTRHQVGNATGYVLGLSGDITIADPFRFAYDLAYSKTSTNHKEWSRSGYFASVSASYQTKYGVPTLKLWYGSGDDGNINNGSERGVGGNGGSADMNIWGQSRWGNLLHAYEGGSLFGSWGVSLQFNKVSFIDKLTHSLRIGFAQGTNNKKMAFYARRSPNGLGMESPGFAIGYLTTADRLFEVDFESRYEIYKQLEGVLECGYMFADIDGDVWGKRNYAGGPVLAGGKAKFSNPWRVSFMLKYKF